jgi:uncharacterized membrane protein
MISAASVTSCSKEICMAFRRRNQFYCLLAVAACSAIGCGESSSTVTVHGNVTYQGNPLAGSVTFFPTSGRPVNTALSADGHYEVELEPGDYTVTVNYTEPLPSGFKEGDPMPQPKIVLPPEYSTRARSTLSASVSEGQSEPINFDLK